MTDLQKVEVKAAVLESVIDWGNSTDQSYQFLERLINRAANRVEKVVEGDEDD